MKRWGISITLVICLAILLCVSSCSGMNFSQTDTGTQSESLSDTQTLTVTETESETITETETVEINPSFTYAYATNAAGYAGGSILVKTEIPGAEVTLYWADEDGEALENYSFLSFGVADENGDCVIVIPDTTYLPSSADAVLAVFGEDASNAEICHIPKNKRLSNENAEFVFGALSDVHIGIRYDEDGTIQETHFNAALNALANLGAQMIAMSGDCVCGATASMNTVEPLMYGQIISDFQVNHSDIGVYTCTGNHECIWGLNVSMYVQNFHIAHDSGYTGGLTRVKYGNDELDFAVPVGDDIVFLFLSQQYTEYSKNTSDPHLLEPEQLDWLAERLNENSGKTVFLFFHTYLDDGAGDASSTEYEYDAPYCVDDADENRFHTLLDANPNVIFCNGHSHYKFEMMFYSPAAEGKSNLYTNFMGDGVSTFTQVHIPSAAAPRYIETENPGSCSDDVNDSQGYLVRVFEDCVVFYGYDFVSDTFLSYATYVTAR